MQHLISLCSYKLSICSINVLAFHLLCYIEPWQKYLIISNLFIHIQWTCNFIEYSWEGIELSSVCPIVRHLNFIHSSCPHDCMHVSISTLWHSTSDCVIVRNMLFSERITALLECYHNGMRLYSIIKAFISVHWYA